MQKPKRLQYVMVCIFVTNICLRQAVRVSQDDYCSRRRCPSHRPDAAPLFQQHAS